MVERLASNLQFALVASYCAVAVLLTGCSGGQSLGSDATAEQRYDAGKASVESEDYLAAITHFETLLLQFPASEVADDAQFYLAESYYNSEEYFTAAFQYSRVLTDFRGSPYYKRALFMTGECYFAVSPKYHRDQKRTKRAMSQYDAFIGYFPDDSLAAVARERIASLREKLAQRDFSVAEGYFDRDEFAAAVIYFKRLVDRYPNSRWAAEAMPLLGEAERRVAVEDSE